MKVTSRRLEFIALILLSLLVTPAFGADTAAYDTALVEIRSDTGLSRGHLTVALAQSPRERYIGLSQTKTLAQNKGMLFVYSSEDTRTFVMRGMNFPLDILFFDDNGVLGAIHPAPVPDGDSLSSYQGRARWVVEVNRGWTDRHNVVVGDRLHSIRKK